jgi:hypothetical protein
MVPTLKITKGKLKENGFINAYCRDDKRDTQYKECIYLLFKPEDFDKFRSFLDGEHERTKSIVDDYDYEDGYVVVVYKLNSKWKKDFALVKEGLYSQTSTDFQNLFPRTTALQKGKIIKDEVTLQHRVFNKAPDLRSYWEEKIDISFTEDMEVWEGFDINKETLDLEKFKTEETA